MLSTEQPQTARDVGPNHSDRKETLGHTGHTYLYSCSPADFFGFGQHVKGQRGVNYESLHDPGKGS